MEKVKTRGRPKKKNSENRNIDGYNKLLKIYFLLRDVMIDCPELNKRIEEMKNELEKELRSQEV